MCVGGIRSQSLLSPISTSQGRSALTMGAAGALAQGKKKKPLPVAPPILAPTESLRNSSLFNNSPMGG